MTAVMFELECGTCGVAFVATPADLGPDDYLIRNGRAVAHDCPGCQGERKESDMQNDDKRPCEGSCEGEITEAVYDAQTFLFGAEKIGVRHLADLIRAELDGCQRAGVTVDDRQLFISAFADWAGVLPEDVVAAVRHASTCEPC